MTLLEKTLKKIAPVNEKWLELAQARLDLLTKPPGSLGRLEEFARRLAAIRETLDPVLGKKAIFVFAGDHGVAQLGVSAYPQEVTAQMVFNFLSGGAGINVLARHVQSDVIVVDIGVAADLGEVPNLVNRKVVRGTRNFTLGPAMTVREATACLEVGIELADDYADRGYGLLGTGEMGIGNSTAAAAIAAVFTGHPVEELTGRGTGIDDAAWKKKVTVIKEALKVNQPDPGKALAVLAQVGGAEIGGIAGLILGAAARRVPVVVDGFISTAGALIACRLAPATADYLFVGHQSWEIGHQASLAVLGHRPILNLDLRLGEGTGAALAMSIIEGGLKIMKEMATFSEAGVSSQQDFR